MDARKCLKDPIRETLQLATEVSDVTTKSINETRKNKKLSHFENVVKADTVQTNIKHLKTLIRV